MSGSRTTRLCSSGRSSAIDPPASRVAHGLRTCRGSRAPSASLATPSARARSDRAGHAARPHLARARSRGRCRSRRTRGVDDLRPQRGPPGPEVVLEQADDRAERVHHQPLADEPGAVREPGRARTAAAGAACRSRSREQDGHRAPDLVLDAVGVEVDRRRHAVRPRRERRVTSACVSSTPSSDRLRASACGRRSPSRRRDAFRHVAPYHGLSAAVLRVAIASGAGHQCQPSVVVRLATLRPIAPSGTGGSGGTLAGRERGVAGQAGDPEVGSTRVVVGLEVLVGERPVVGDAVERPHAEVRRHDALPLRGVEDRAAADAIQHRAA